MSADRPHGFPSPADDHLDNLLDPVELLAPRKSSTYFVRVSGQSMRGAWIRDGDIVVVDTSITPRSGQIAVVVLDGRTLIRRLGRTPDGLVALALASPRHAVLVVQPEQDFRVWGVVTWALHRQLPESAAP